MSLEVSINAMNAVEEVKRILSEFEQLHNVKVDLQVYDWSASWAELMKISLYRHGPVISEVGSTWMSSLAGQNSLRPFKLPELAAIGDARKFLPESWQTCMDFDGHTVLAIPWTMNTYLAYYRRDLFARAGIDEASAFSNIDHFIHTLECLQTLGVEIPIAIPNSGNSVGVLHNAACFVWQMGGDFITADGKQVSFSDPKTLAGLKQYFGLHRFMPAAARNLYDDACSNAFVEGRAAITFRSMDLLALTRNDKVQKDVTEHTGIAVQPGTPFVGGSNLVIWNHVAPNQEPLAVEFVKYMTCAETMMKEFHQAKYTPANLDALNQVELDPTYLPLTQSLKKGRAFKRVPLWGLVEDKLVKALNHIWQVIFATPEPDVEKIIENNLLPLEDRLNITLSQ